MIAGAMIALATTVLTRQGYFHALRTLAQQHTTKLDAIEELLTQLSRD